MSAVGTFSGQLSGSARQAPRASYALLAALAVGYAVATAFGHGATPAAAAVAMTVAFAAPALTLLRGALVPRERAAWTAIGVALLMWAIGDLIVVLATLDGRELQIPSPSDAAYLLFYPAIALGLVLLVRERVQVASAVVWLDGLVAVLAIAAVAALLAVAPLAEVTGDTVAQVAINLAYPLLDLLLAVGVAGWLALRCGRLGADVVLIAGGLLVSAIADVAYFVETAGGSYEAGGALSNAYLLASLLVGWAAWQGPARAVVLRESGHRVVVPVVAGAACIAVLVADHHTAVATAAVWLAAAGLATVLVRFVVTFRAAQRLLAERAGQALTDPLTGLGNRRALTDHLAAIAAGQRGPGSQVVVLLDLDGFKRFNDSRGHVAGDRLLCQVGERLTAVAAVAGGSAYRLGGDEFCLLAPAAAAPARGERLQEAVLAALREPADGGGGVAASVGCAPLAPGGEPDRALALADRRMYAQKAARRS